MIRNGKKIKTKQYFKTKYLPLVSCTFFIFLSLKFFRISFGVKWIWILSSFIHISIKYFTFAIWWIMIQLTYIVSYIVLYYIYCIHSIYDIIIRNLIMIVKKIINDCFVPTFNICGIKNWECCVSFYEILFLKQIIRHATFPTRL